MATDASKRKVLFVEDESALQTSYARFFGSRYDMAFARTGAEALQQIEGLRFYGNVRNRAGVLSFLVGDIHPFDMGEILDKQGIAVRTGHHCAQPVMDRYCIPGTVRASLAFYNTPAEMDRLAAGIRKAVSLLG